MLVTILAAFGAPLPSAVQAQNARSWKSEGDPVRHVVVTLYKSKTFHLDQPFSTAVVGSPDIADALPMSDRTLYIQGKRVGTTNVTVFDQNRLMGVLDVEVTTAKELSDTEFKRIVTDIENRSGRAVQASRHVDPDLIGGIVLQAGSMRLDASVRGRLDRLRQELATTRS